MNFLKFAFIALLSIILAAYVDARPGMVGGLSNVRPADSELTGVFNSAKLGILNANGLSASNVSLEPVTYATQVVAGTNYFVKIAASSGSEKSYLHCRLFRPLPPNHNDIQVVKCEATTKDAPLTYF